MADTTASPETTGLDTGSPTGDEATPQRPTKPRLRVRTLFIAAGVIAFTLHAARESGWDWSSFVTVWTNPIWQRFWPIDWEFVLDRNNVLEPLLETFQIAIPSS